MDREKVHQIVIEKYSDIVKSGGISCSSCCGETGSGISFEDLGKAPDKNSNEIISSWNAAEGAEDMVFSAYIQAVK